MEWFGFILTAVLLPLVLSELQTMSPYLAEKLIRWGARKLPAKDRERYRDEWLGEFDVLAKAGGRFGLLLYASSIALLAVPKTRSILGERQALASGESSKLRTEPEPQSPLKPKQLSLPGLSLGPEKSSAAGSQPTGTRSLGLFIMIFIIGAFVNGSQVSELPSGQAMIEGREVAIETKVSQIDPDFCMLSRPYNCEGNGAGF